MTSAKRSVSVRLRGQEFRLLTDENESSLQKVADYVDQTMAKLEQRTGTVDSLDVALLTALNLAREVVELRQSLDDGGAADPDRLRALIELAETTATATTNETR